MEQKFVYLKPNQNGKMVLENLRTLCMKTYMNPKFAGSAYIIY